MTKNTRESISSARWIATMLRVRESRGRARFAKESLSNLGRAREAGRQHLDRDLAIQLHVVREGETMPIPPRPSSRSMSYWPRSDSARGAISGGSDVIGAVEGEETTANGIAARAGR